MEKKCSRCDAVKLLKKFPKRSKVCFVCKYAAKAADKNSFKLLPRDVQELALSMIGKGHAWRDISHDTGVPRYLFTIWDRNGFITLENGHGPPRSTDSRTCSKCKVEKPHGEFHLTIDKPHVFCMPCRDEKFITPYLPPPSVFHAFKDEKKHAIISDLNDGVPLFQVCKTHSLSRASLRYWLSKNMLIHSTELTMPQN